MNKYSDCGIVYVAAGEGFVEEARISAESAKSEMPDIPITLITDEEVDMCAFDNVRKITKPRYDGGDRVLNIDKTPYNKTIFLDTDTYIEQEIYDVFDLLDKFDFSACLNKTKYASNRINISEITNLPTSFPEYNGGVIAIKMNPKMKKFIHDWKKAFYLVSRNGQIHNQAALRYALYKSNIKIATLPPEYNCIFRTPGYVSEEVKIFHGRILDIDSYGAGKSTQIGQAVNEINSRTDLRLHHRIGDEVKLVNQSLFERILYSISTHGLLGTARRFPKFLRRKLSS